MPWERRDGLWLTLAPAPVIYLAAITLHPDAASAALRDVRGAVVDAWCTLDLQPLGYEAHHLEPWFFRPPEPLPREDDPDELEIERIVEPAGAIEFEAVSARGFGGEDATVSPGSIHPPISDPRMTLWIGRVDGVAVGAAMSYRTDEVVGIFGVTTTATARGRGYGSALTRRALLLDTGLPAVLGPSPEAERMYLRLGFRHVGEARHWRPGPVTRMDPKRVRT